MDIVEASEGRAVFSLEPAEWMFNPIGSIHGGIAATLLDSCMGCAVQTMLPPGAAYTTSDLQVRYLRAMSSTPAGCSPRGRSSTPAAARRPPRDASSWRRPAS